MPLADENKGHGTRFGVGQFDLVIIDDKRDFRVFDFCFNFDFFRENPEGINAHDSAPLGTRLFRARVQLPGHVQTVPDLDPDTTVRESLTPAQRFPFASLLRPQPSRHGSGYGTVRLLAIFV